MKKQHWVRIVVRVKITVKTVAERPLPPQWTALALLLVLVLTHGQHSLPAHYPG